MDLAAVSMENGYSVGITKQGELLGHNVTLEPMNRIVAVLAGSTRVLALDVQGKVYEFPFMERDSLALEGIQGVQAMAQSATHALLLFNDGTVMATGENGKGQCEVDGWQISSAE